MSLQNIDRIKKQPLDNQNWAIGWMGSPRNLSYLYQWAKPLSVRSSHPIFSFVDIGKKALSLMSDVSKDSFGYDSVFDRLFACKAKGLFLNLAIRNSEAPPSTLIYYIEQKFGVDYSYKKEFSGKIVDDRNTYEDTFLYNVRNFDLDVRTDCAKIYQKSLKAGCIRTYMIDFKFPVSVGEIEKYCKSWVKNARAK